MCSSVLQLAEEFCSVVGAGVGVGDVAGRVLGNSLSG